MQLNKIGGLLPLRLFEDDPVDALSECQAMLDEPETATIIRPGHIYAVMIKGLIAHERFRAVSSTVKARNEIHK